MKIRNILFYISLFTLLTSCEEIVEIDLKTTDPKIVIDASITDGLECVVILSKTQAFKNNDYPELISGATIILADNLGNSEILKESSHQYGIYYSDMEGVEGRTYQLEVRLEENVYTASGTIPPKVEIEDVYIYGVRIGKEHWYSPCVVYNDPANVLNYYNATLSINDNLMQTVYLQDDEFRDGLQVKQILFYNKEDNDDESLKYGDRIGVELQTLDFGIYNFYKTLLSFATGRIANPATNISGGALGCFKAYNSTYMDIIITEEKIQIDNE